MTEKEKLDKVSNKFSLLPEEKQDHILGILQALAFAHDMATEQTETGCLDLGENTDTGEFLRRFE